MLTLAYILSTLAVWAFLACFVSTLDRGAAR